MKEVFLLLVSTVASASLWAQPNASLLTTRTAPLRSYSIERPFGDPGQRLSGLAALLLPGAPAIHAGGSGRWTARAGNLEVVYYGESGSVSFQDRVRKWAQTPGVEYTIAPEETEQIARNYLESVLLKHQIVRLSPNDRILFLGLQYLRSQRVSSGKYQGEKTHAAIAVFGREIDGIPVEGIAPILIHLSPRGDVTAFEVNWRNLGPAKDDSVEPLLARETIRKLVEQSSDASVRLVYVDSGPTAPVSEFRPAILMKDSSSGRERVRRFQLDGRSW